MNPISLLSTAFLPSTTRNRSWIRLTRHLASTTAMLGGEFAGQYATFSPFDGKVIHVPDHLVPEAMIEWGQVPSCLECLVSEDWIMVEEDDDNRPTFLERSTVTVFPETGCGIDNLETSTSTTKLNVEQMQFFDLNGDNEDALKIGIWFDEKEQSLHFVISIIHTDKDQMQRCRVTIHLDETLKHYRKRPPIEVVRERQTSKASSKGSAGKSGGGLYGSTVMELIGKEHIHRPFSDQEGPNVSSFEGYWYRLKDESDNIYWNINDNALSIPAGLGSLVLENMSDLDSNASVHSKFSMNFILNQNNESDKMRRVVAECSILQDGKLHAKVYDLYKC